MITNFVQNEDGSLLYFEEKVFSQSLPQRIRISKQHVSWMEVVEEEKEEEDCTCLDWMTVKDKHFSILSVSDSAKFEICFIAQ